MEPMIIGRLLQLAAIKSSDVVLLVGCGTGYVAAVVARLASRVVAVESDAALRAWARQAIDGLGVTNVTIMAAPLNEGAPGQAPYDVIVFDGSVDVVPAGILDQLGEGGRLVAVLNKDRVGRAMLMTRTAGVIAGRPAFDAAVPRLPGLEVPAAFVF
jgi:protein-L-isoaspartate(D-aspartate) O-methyltransferase